MTEFHTQIEIARCRRRGKFEHENEKFTEFEIKMFSSEALQRDTATRAHEQQTRGKFVLLQSMQWKMKSLIGLRMFRLIMQVCTIHNLSSTNFLSFFFFCRDFMENFVFASQLRHFAHGNFLLCFRSFKVFEEF